MKTTRYFDYTGLRPDRSEIRDEWIMRALDAPLEEKVQTDGHMRRWVHVGEVER